MTAEEKAAADAAATKAAADAAAANVVAVVPAAAPVPPVKSPEQIALEAAQAYEASLRAATLTMLAAKARKDNAVGTFAYIGAGCAVAGTILYALKS